MGQTERLIVRNRNYSQALKRKTRQREPVLEQLARIGSKFIAFNTRPNEEIHTRSADFGSGLGNCPQRTQHPQQGSPACPRTARTIKRSQCLSLMTATPHKPHISWGAFEIGRVDHLRKIQARRKKSDKLLI
jgi:hypothetical protein